MIHLILALSVVIAVIRLMCKADGDLTLLFKEIFGIRVRPDLKEKVIWITGASSGIGEALTYQLCALGAKVVISGTNNERLQKVSQTCIEKYSAKHEDILVLPFNIADFEIHEQKFKYVLEHFGKLNILINNAGRSQRSAFENIELAVDKDLFDVNVFGAVNLTRITLPHFLENKSGHYVVTSSTAGIFGAPFSATYTATKHALHGYFEALRSEHYRNGINVTICCPGPTKSRVVENCCTGKLGERYVGTDSAKRMSAERCAELMIVAMANNLDQAWIANQPMLLTHYLAQYTPSFFRNWIITHIPKSYADKLRGGAVQSS